MKKLLTIATLLTLSAACFAAGPRHDRDDRMVFRPVAERPVIVSYVAPSPLIVDFGFDLGQAPLHFDRDHLRARDRRDDWKVRDRSDRR